MAVEDLGQDANLFEDGIPLWVDVELEVDDDGILNIISNISVDDMEDIVIRKPFYEVIELMLHQLSISYFSLYEVANELVRESERLREKAQRMEDSTGNVSDLFDADYDAT